MIRSTANWAVHTASTKREGPIARQCFGLMEDDI